MSKDIILIGGGGHCVSCIDVIESDSQYIIRGILDTDENVGKKVLGYPVLGTDLDISMYAKEGCYFLITVGHIKSATLRVKLYKEVVASGGKFATVVSSRAYVAKSASIGDGTIVMHDALINANSHVAENCIINSKALIEHDCHIKSNCHVSTAASINGGVEVGERTFFGSNAVSKQGVVIEADSFIKANSCFTGAVRKRIAFLTTIFPIDHSYVIEFFDSLSAQTRKDFELIVVNDGYINFEEIKASYLDLKIIELPSAGNIAKNREFLINYVKRNAYDIAIFGDIDDIFSSNRIERVVSELKYSDIVVNELTAVKDGKIVAENIYSPRVCNKQVVSFDFIKDKNIFGLSNTAININCLPSELLNFPDDLVAVDWYFYSLLLNTGLKALFINDVVTYYRQYSANTVGASALTTDNLKKILDVKEIHYEHMFQVSNEFEALLNRVYSLKELIKNETGLNELLSYNKKMIKHPLWWELLDFRNKNENI
ncbi:MAG: NeuD/PglB/VioB family sugar acetyltransferase [Colwellia sp.]